MPYIHFTLPMSSLLEIGMMIDPFFGLELYATFAEFMKEFMKPAFLHLQRFYNGIVQTNYVSAIRRARNGVQYHVWARVQAGYFPAVEVRFNELEERDITQYPGERNHRAG